MNGNPCARAGGAFAYVMGNYREVERKRLDSMQADVDRVARGLLPVPRLAQANRATFRQNATAADVDAYLRSRR